MPASTGRGRSGGMQNGRGFRAAATEGQEGDCAQLWLYATSEMPT